MGVSQLQLPITLAEWKENKLQKKNNSCNTSTRFFYTKYTFTYSLIQGCHTFLVPQAGSKLWGSLQARSSLGHRWYQQWHFWLWNGTCSISSSQCVPHAQTTRALTLAQGMWVFQHIHIRPCFQLFKTLRSFYHLAKVCPAFSQISV